MIHDEAKASDTVTWGISYAAGPRPWQEWWNRVEASLQELREYYAGQRNVTDSRTFLDAIANFFVRCSHVRDQLIHDPAVTVPKKTILDFFWNSDPLSLSGDFADTWKHHTRTAASGHNGRLPRSVKIGGISSNFRATVAWMDPVTNVQHSRDVLALAEQAVDDWRTFFQMHQL